MGFVGFGGLQGTPGASNLGYVPMAAGVSEDVDACVDPEFRMVMRKLMKRDAVTKLKVNYLCCCKIIIFSIVFCYFMLLLDPRRPTYKVIFQLSCHD